MSSEARRSATSSEAGVNPVEPSNGQRSRTSTWVGSTMIGRRSRDSATEETDHPQSQSFGGR